MSNKTKTIPELCITCDYWEVEPAAEIGAAMGRCDLFRKKTASDHGRQCTAWKLAQCLAAQEKEPRE